MVDGFWLTRCRKLVGESRCYNTFFPPSCSRYWYLSLIFANTVYWSDGSVLKQNVCVYSYPWCMTWLRWKPCVKHDQTFVKHDQMPWMNAIKHFYFLVFPLVFQCNISANCWHFSSSGLRYFIPRHLPDSTVHVQQRWGRSVMAHSLATHHRFWMQIVFSGANDGNS